MARRLPIKEVTLNTEKKNVEIIPAESITWWSKKQLSKVLDMSIREVDESLVELLEIGIIEKNPADPEQFKLANNGLPVSLLYK